MALWRDKAYLKLPFTSLYFSQDEIVVTFAEIIAVQIKYNPYSYSCPRSVAIDCKRKRERKRGSDFFFFTAVQTLHQGRAMTRDLYFIRLLDPGRKQWLLIGWRNGHELLGCSLFWDHTSKGTFYLMKSGNSTPFRSTLCVCSWPSYALGTNLQKNVSGM